MKFHTYTDKITDHKTKMLQMVTMDEK